MKTKEKKKKPSVNWFNVIRTSLFLLFAIPFVLLVNSTETITAFYDDWGWTFAYSRPFRVLWFLFTIFSSYELFTKLLNVIFHWYFVRHEDKIIKKQKVNYIIWHLKKTWYFEVFNKKRGVSEPNQILLVKLANEMPKLKNLFFDYKVFFDAGVRFLFLESGSSLTSLQTEFVKEKGLDSWIIDSYIENHDSKSLLRLIEAGLVLSDNKLERLYEMPDMTDVFMASCEKVSLHSERIELLFVKKCIEIKDFEPILDYTRRKVKRLGYGLSVNAEVYLFEKNFEQFRCYLVYTEAVNETTIGKLIDLAVTSGVARETLWNCYSRNFVTGKNALKLFKLSLEDINFTEYFDLFVNSGLTNEMQLALTLYVYKLQKTQPSALQGHTVYNRPD